MHIILNSRRLLRLICKDSIITKSKLCLNLLSILSFSDLVAQSLEIQITKLYLNIPIGIGNDVRAKLMQLRINGKLQREFAIQIAEDSASHWIYIDVFEFRANTTGIGSI